MNFRYKCNLFLLLVIGFLAIADVSAQRTNRRPKKNPRNYQAKVEKPPEKAVTTPVVNPVVLPPTVSETPSENSSISPDNPKESLDKNFDSASSNELMFREIRKATVAEERLTDDIAEAESVTKITSNANPVVKLFLSEHGLSLIEFPADDPVYAIYPADENYITVDCPEPAANAKNGTACGNSPQDAIVFRPGKLFNKWQTDPNGAATVITVQRVSGKVVTFVVYPVKSVTENTFHVVIRYDLDKTVDSRMRAGLAVNLNALTNNNALVSKVPVRASGDQTQPGDNLSDTTPAGDLTADLENTVLTRMKEAAVSKAKIYFSKPTYDLSIATFPSDTTNEYTIQVVAVRNTSKRPIRLVPEQPDLSIESRDKKENIISERVSALYIATTVEADDILLPGKVYYIGVVFKQPILSSRQAVKIAVAGRDAADQPAVVYLNELR